MRGITGSNAFDGSHAGRVTSVTMQKRVLEFGHGPNGTAVTYFRQPARDKLGWAECAEKAGGKRGLRKQIRHPYAKRSR